MLLWSMKKTQLQLEPQLMVIQLMIGQFALIIVLRKELTVQPRVVIMAEKTREVNGMIEGILIAVGGGQGVEVGIGAIDAEVVAEAETDDVTADDLEALLDTDDKSTKSNCLKIDPTLENLFFKYTKFTKLFICSNI